MKHLFLYILLFIGFAHYGNAQKKIQVDSSRVDVREISPGVVKNYHSQKSFQYNRDKAVSKSVIQRIWDWFWDKYYEILGNEGGNSLLKIIMWAFVVLGLTYFLLKVIGMDAFSLFGKKNREKDLGYKILEENLHTINFNEAIDNAVQQKNYRLAVRLLYLQSLKKLTDTGFISWQLNKTNRQYAQELAEGSLGKPFTSITKSFEYAWYGEFPLVKEEYEMLRNEFISFLQLI